ncbi:MAG: Ribosome-binding factor [Planctomycetota bacterium]|jgi:ribosome-binding factor A
MSSRRLLKAAEAIREVVSMAILTELKDPRVKNVTVTYVEVAADMRSAKVHVSIMGGETQQNLALRGLQNAAGFLQHLLSEKIDTRYTPRLVFLLDQGVKHSIAVAEILRGVLPAAPAVVPESAGESTLVDPDEIDDVSDDSDETDDPDDADDSDDDDEDREEEDGESADGIEDDGK